MPLYNPSTGGGGSTYEVPLLELLGGGGVLPTASAAPGTNVLRGNRYVCKKAGQLRDVAVYLGGLSGNLIVAVYDTGQATSGTRTKLWDTGVLASGGFSANTWNIIGDPNIAVTEGQQVDIGVICDNATMTIGRLALAAAGSGILPTGFGGVTTATPKAGWTHSPGSHTAPATIAEAGFAGSGQVTAIMARVV